VALSEDQVVRCLRYLELLLEWNTRVNLTAIRDPHEAVVKHFLDSLTLAPLLPGREFSMVDVGTGAGFPGMVVKILRPDVRLTLLDSLKKRLAFLEAVSGELGLDAVETLHARAEDAGRDARYREKFDVAAARAVADVRTLSELCLPLVRVGGRFLAMKGPRAEGEQDAAAGAQRKLGGTYEGAHLVALPFTQDSRTVLVIRKDRPTPARYPRRPAEIKRLPL
jgi:16S rRNA (guanine527-N7)-methyltransferase